MVLSNSPHHKRGGSRGTMKRRWSKGLEIGRGRGVWTALGVLGVGWRRKWMMVG